MICEQRWHRQALAQDILLKLPLFRRISEGQLLQLTR